jgi:hypothetical protein
MRLAAALRIGGHHAPRGCATHRRTTCASRLRYASADNMRLAAALRIGGHSVGGATVSHPARSKQALSHRAARDRRPAVLPYRCVTHVRPREIGGAGGTRRGAPPDSHAASSRHRRATAPESRRVPFIVRCRVENFRHPFAWIARARREPIGETGPHGVDKQAPSGPMAPEPRWLDRTPAQSRDQRRPIRHARCRIDSRIRLIRRQTERAATANSHFSATPADDRGPSRRRLTHVGDRPTV